MIVPDLNLLIYAHNDGAHHHLAARQWWEALLEGDEPVGLPWVVSTGFIRLMVNSRLLVSPLSPSAAIDYVDNWLDHTHVVPLNPTDVRLVLLRQCLDIRDSGTNTVTDAHIAALALEYDAVVHTSDADFSRFPGLRWRNPLR